MLFLTSMMKKQQSNETKKDKLYEEITKHCDWLHIARYLKNEARNALKYFHVHKLSNIKKNITEFSDYLIFLNDENCHKIEWFTTWKESKRILNNSISYFYDHENTNPSELDQIQRKIETNSYETITLMQSLKWYLILTIDEFCNASPTRIDIMRYNLWKKNKKMKEK